jgi:hypothetical protein
MGGASSAYGGGVYRVLVRKPEGKKQLSVDGKITLRWIFGSGMLGYALH